MSAMLVVEEGHTMAWRFWFPVSEYALKT